MTTIPNHLIDKAARAVMDAWCFSPEYIENVPKGAAANFADAALYSVADDLRAEAWDDCAREVYGPGCIHESVRDDLIDRNPYRQEQANE